MHGGRQKQQCSAERIYEPSQPASVRKPQLIDLSLSNGKKAKTQSTEIVKRNPGEEPKEAARDKIIKDRNEHNAQTKSKRVPKKVVKPQELSLTSENEHSVQSKGKPIPKMAQELSLTSENEHSVQSKGKPIPKMAQEFSFNSENESPLMEKDKPSFIATIEQTRDIPAGSRNLFEITLSDIGKKSPCEGQLLVTEANNAVRKDGCIFVRSALSTVKRGRVLIEVLNLGRKNVKLEKGERITRVFEVKCLPTRSIRESPMDVTNMHRKNVRKKRLSDRRKREVINATRETLMKKIHEDGKRKARQSKSKNEIPTKSLRLTPRQLRETYRAILTKTSREGSVLRNRNELERMIDFLIRNRDIVGLADDPIGKYPGYEFKLELEPDCPKVADFLSRYIPEDKEDMRDVESEGSEEDIDHINHESLRSKPVALSLDAQIISKAQKTCPKLEFLYKEMDKGKENIRISDVQGHDFH
ncbi:hypothetical protein Avbf_16067 [Armadillidium vulgare]|nr:hypothetical protein Avbf_16067 [Armadillidium vulgare]